MDGSWGMDEDCMGNMVDGWMGLKHNSWNVTCFSGICLRGLGYLGIETCAGPLAETWHVSVGGRFQGSCFEAHVSWCVVSNQRKWALGDHWNMTCFRVGLLQGPCCLCVETHTGSLRNEWCIFDLLLK
jgi:hypothetical protein